MKRPRRHFPQKSGRKSDEKAMHPNHPTGNVEDPLGTLFPGITAKQREVVIQLQARAAEVQQWFAEKPERVAELQKKPHETVSQLSRALGITLPVSTPENLPKNTILLNPLICVCGPPRESLISAVWQFIGQSDTNLAAWKADPLRVIQEMATTTGASDQDLNTLINAFNQVFGGATRSPTALIQRLQGLKPTKLIIQ